MCSGLAPRPMPMPPLMNNKSRYTRPTPKVYSDDSSLMNVALYGAMVGSMDNHSATPSSDSFSGDGGDFGGGGASGDF